VNPNVCSLSHRPHDSSNPFFFDRSLFHRNFFGGDESENALATSLEEPDSSSLVPSSAGYIITSAVKPTASDRHVIAHAAYGGLLPYKWRKKYPIYGRKKRSAQ
jgi:hypothetical protein